MVSDQARLRTGVDPWMMMSLDHCCPTQLSSQIGNADSVSRGHTGVSIIAWNDIC